MPVNYISWADAARFCNWLDNDQPVGPEGNGTTETGAYTLNGATTWQLLTAVSRNAGAKYVIPSENEWYKAAYYDASNGTYWTYPTQSNTTPNNVLSATGTNNANFEIYNSRYTDPTNYLTPVGSFAGTTSPYGAYDMGGDVWQWTEASVGSDLRILRGGSFSFYAISLASSYRLGDDPADGSDVIGGLGFRVASVPEPGGITLLLAGGLCLLGYVLRRRFARA
jgi:formylglycine-generating enzyme required for sulfatase activity